MQRLHHQTSCIRGICGGYQTPGHVSADRQHSSGGDAVILKELLTGRRNTKVQEAKETILIVEDDLGVARLQRKHLERAGYQVLTATTGVEALEHVHHQAVDLIFLDYRLPSDHNGLEFYEQLKAQGYNIPVIIVTGFSDEATVIKALRSGV